MRLILTGHWLSDMAGPNAGLRGGLLGVLTVARHLPVAPSKTPNLDCDVLCQKGSLTVPSGRHEIRSIAIIDGTRLGQNRAFRCSLGKDAHNRWTTGETDTPVNGRQRRELVRTQADCGDGHTRAQPVRPATRGSRR